MDIETLESFVAFAESGCNLTVAGQRSGLSQPAMHARLQSLASELETTLYVRVARKLVLTENGRKVLAWARGVVGERRALLGRLRGAVDEERVLVACGEGVLVHVLAERVAAFARRHPGRLSFLTGPAPVSVERVQEGAAHLAVVAGSPLNAGDLRQALVARTSPCALVQPGHALAKSRSVKLRDLLGHALVVPPLGAGSPLRASLEERAAALGTPVRVAAEVSGWEAVVRLAELGVGVGIVNDVVRTRQLARIAISGLPGTTYRLLSRRTRLPPLAEEVASLLRAA